MTAPKRTVRTSVVAHGPEKAATRVHREAAELEAHTPQRLLEGYRAKAKAHVKTLPIHAWRHWRRWSDITLPATFLAFAALFLRFPGLAIWPSWTNPGLAIWPSWTIFQRHLWHLGRWASLLCAAGSIAAVVHFWHIGNHRARQKSTRWTDRKAKPVVTICTPNLIPIAHHQYEHKTVDVCRLPVGTTADDYRKQAPRLETTLHHPVTIRAAGPGKITVTQHLHDLLANPIPRHQPAGNYNPQQLWRGINRDDEPFYTTLSRDGSGYAHLIAGAPDAGKSVLLNNDLAQLAHRDDVQLWIVDPASGADLGIWHDHTYRLATTPDTGIELFGNLLSATNARLERMVKDHLQKAPINDDYPLVVLVLDELPLFTLHPDPKQRTLAVERLTTLRRVGRKTNLAIIAATQDTDANVIPRTMSKLFSHRTCLRVATWRDADMVLPNARKAYGYDASAISPQHHGRGIAFDGADYTEFRAPAFYGRELRDFVSNLAAPPVQPDLYVPAEWSQPVQLDTVSALPPPTFTDIDVSSDYLSVPVEAALSDAAIRAGRKAVNLTAFSEQTGYNRRTVARAAKRLRMVQVRPGWWAQREAVR